MNNNTHTAVNEDAALFLPATPEDMRRRGWERPDFLLVTGDAYVDHPSFGAAVIGRLLESQGYHVAVLAQPDWHNPSAFSAYGRPRLAALVTGGNIDSMVAHYTAAKKKRDYDYYSPGGKTGLRPDRAVTVYSRALRSIYPDLPIILGGLEASLRRFAHYDYWANAVHPSVLISSQADLLVFGMGEYAITQIARVLSNGKPAAACRRIRGLCLITQDERLLPKDGLHCPAFEEVKQDKQAYAEAALMQHDEQDAVYGKPLIQRHGDVYVIQNRLAPLPSSADLDAVAELPYRRAPHPMYHNSVGSIEEVRFSLIHNRGCFGGCHFCSLAFHQGRSVTARSHDSLLREAEALTRLPDFKGYIHDCGGPTANFRQPSCGRQREHGLCRGKNCLTPVPCSQLKADHRDYLSLLRKLRALPGVKKVFVRSGLRYDYLMLDPDDTFFHELVRHHISGQLKTAPEHCVEHVLDAMGKPRFGSYTAFLEKYKKINAKYHKQQFTVPYLISSHPGCTLNDAVELALTLKRWGRMPEQVQDFYPTPGTLSTAMYYTGLNPRTGKEIYVAKTARDKAMQRALLQWQKPDKRKWVEMALREAGREDLLKPGGLLPVRRR
jgi:uncharacterized radical SAM protein YgiQ